MPGMLSFSPGRVEDPRLAPPPAKLCVTPRSAPAHLGSQAQDGVISLVEGDAQLILHQLAACGTDGHGQPVRHENEIQASPRQAVGGFPACRIMCRGNSLMVHQYGWQCSPPVVSGIGRPTASNKGKPPHPRGGTHEARQVATYVCIDAIVTLALSSTTPSPVRMAMSYYKQQATTWCICTLHQHNIIQHSPVRMAMSSRYEVLRSPKPGALTATTLSVPRSLFTTRVASASCRERDNVERQER